MRTPLSWLREFAPLEAEVADLAMTFDDLGLVVEGVEHVGEGFGEIVVARVLQVSEIPRVDRIRRVVVDAGGDPEEVVCGAWNFEVGDLVPFAPVGAELPGGFKVSKRRMKGVTSNGMLCSGKELGLSEDHAGILVLGSDTHLAAEPGRAVAKGPHPGKPLAEALGLEPDVVFDLAVEANRPDAMSIVGIARDVAARLGVPFSIPEPYLAEGKTRTGQLATVVVESPELCPRFTARVLTDVAISPSPDWMARRLMLAGMRPINSVVDASNYVMLELGQPNHPYDLDRLQGSGIVVRVAKPGEVVVTLDGEERHVGGDGRAGLGAEDCLICDAAGTPVGIGGIMGGALAEISELTTRVLLETAYFAPMAIARTSRRLGLRTEASVRFERGCDPEGIERAAARFCQLLVSAGRDSGIQVGGGTVDVTSGLDLAPRLRVRTARVNGVLGTQLKDRDIKRYLDPIGFKVRKEASGVLQVEVPSFRPDTTREIDVIEEVARHHGYSRIRRTMPYSPHVGSLTTYQQERRRVREILAGAGATEAWTASLLGPSDHERAGIEGPVVEVENPLAREESTLRRSLLPGLLKAVRFNLDRRQDRIRLFEIGHVFAWPAEGQQLPDERERLGVALAASGDGAEAAVHCWRTLSGALLVKGVSLEAAPLPGLHPTRTARLVVDGSGEELGGVGEVDPAVLDEFDIKLERMGWLEVDLRTLIGLPRQTGGARHAQQVSLERHRLGLRGRRPNARSSRRVHPCGGGRGVARGHHPLRRLPWPGAPGPNAQPGFPAALLCRRPHAHRRRGRRDEAAVYNSSRGTPSRSVAVLGQSTRRSSTSSVRPWSKRWPWSFTSMTSHDGRRPASQLVWDRGTRSYSPRHSTNSVCIRE